MNCRCPIGSRPRSFRHEPRQCPSLSTTPSHFPSPLSLPPAKTDQRFLADLLVGFLVPCLRQTRQFVDLDDGPKLGSCPLGRELDRISDQVGNHLTNAMSINCNLGKRRRQVDLECLPLGFGLGSDAIDYRHHHVTQPVWRWCNRKSPALNSGKIEKISDQDFHFIGRTLNLIGEFPHLVRINLLRSRK